MTINDRNKEISALYASRSVLNSLIVTTGFTADLDAFLTTRLSLLSYTPPISVASDSTITDPTSPIGIGNLAGKGVLESLIKDGTNQLGNLGGHNYNKQSYRDYTNYQPVNPDVNLVHPRYWQPFISDDSAGVFSYQTHVVPQLSIVPG